MGEFIGSINCRPADRYWCNKRAAYHFTSSGCYSSGSFSTHRLKPFGWPVTHEVIKAGLGVDVTPWIPIVESSQGIRIDAELPIAQSTFGVDSLPLKSKRIPHRRVPAHRPRIVAREPSRIRSRRRVHRLPAVSVVHVAFDGGAGLVGQREDGVERVLVVEEAMTSAACVQLGDGDAACPVVESPNFVEIVAVGVLAEVVVATVVLLHDAPAVVVEGGGSV